MPGAVELPPRRQGVSLQLAGIQAGRPASSGGQACLLGTAKASYVHALLICGCVRARVFTDAPWCCSPDGLHASPVSGVRIVGGRRALSAVHRGTGLLDCRACSGDVGLSRTSIRAWRPAGNGQVEGHGGGIASVTAGRGTWPAGKIQTEERIAGVVPGCALA